MASLQPDRVEHTTQARERFEHAAVADLRTTAARFPDDASVGALVRDLHAASPRFAAVWAAHRVGDLVGDTKTVHHPQVGPIALVCDVFTVPDSDARIVYFTPPDQQADERLALVHTTGPRRSGEPATCTQA